MQIDAADALFKNLFESYVTDNEGYQPMSRFDMSVTNTEMFAYQSVGLKVLRQQLNCSDYICASFMYYKKSDQLWSREQQASLKLGSFIRSYLFEEENLKYKTEIIDWNGHKYLISIYPYSSFFNGYVFDIEKWMQDMNLDTTDGVGIYYFEDAAGHNTLKEDSVPEGKKLTRYSVANERKNLNYVLLMPANAFLTQMGPFLTVSATCLLFFVVCAPVIAIWIRKKVSKPLGAIEEGISAIAAGDLHYQIPLRNADTEDEFDHMMVAFNDMVKDVNQLTADLYESKISEQRTQLNYMSHQIRPHFILNALNLIYTYKPEEFPLIQKMVVYLAEYFRYIVNVTEDFVELGTEMEHVVNYLHIQMERYKNRMEFYVDMDEDLKKCQIPPLILQTFLENNMKYGFNDKGSLFITVIAQKEGDFVKISIGDTGSGFPDEVLEDTYEYLESGKKSKHLGVGVTNTIERLNMLYKGEAELNFENGENGGTLITLKIPFVVNETDTREERKA
ncbi:MAG: histidine kinase [Parasporobacterium sp.]|nr:histidine kinase [Parasporobacterium sp.]